MSKFCTNCGAELADDALFCPHCGISFAEAEAPATPEEPFPGTVLPESQEAQAPAWEDTPMPAFTSGAAAAAASTPAPAPAPEPAPQKPARSKELSTGKYFWTIFLFRLPIIGLIAELLFAFKAKNKNLKNLSKAYLTWLIVGIVLTTALLIAMKLTAKKLGLEFELNEAFKPLEPILNEMFK